MKDSPPFPALVRRTYRAGDVAADLTSLSYRGTYAGYLEVSPHPVRARFLAALERELAERGRGFHVHELAKIRADVAAGSLEWLPMEYVRADLSSHWCPEGAGEGNTSLTVAWFQQSGLDPFTQLHHVMAQVDWGACAHFTEFDP